MTLNKRQRHIVITGIALLILAGLLPPWVHTIDARSIRSEKPAGYSLIVTPPEPEYYNGAYGVKLDVARLIIQWLVIVAATGLGVYLANGTTHKEHTK